MQTLEIDASGCLHGEGVLREQSPHFNCRPAGVEPDLVIIHNISLPAGVFGGLYIADLFMGRLDFAAHPSFDSLAGLCVSSHFFINREGFITQFVSTEKRAWHAGVSAFQSRENCNDFSIGIELEGSDLEVFEDAQYEALTSLIVAIVKRYPSIRTLTGHCDVSPGRKTDPGPFFDSGRLLQSLKDSTSLKWWHPTDF